MQSVNKIESTSAPMARINVDTDLIIPKQFLKTITRLGLGKFLFYDLRFDEKGEDKPDFILARAEYSNAKILIVGDNFGCGSSREHAVWAIADFGFKAIIGSSFAEIFLNNCYKNGILALSLQKDTVDMMLQDSMDYPESIIKIDLTNQTVIDKQGNCHAFNIDTLIKHRLLNGLDDIDLTMEQEKHISEYEDNAKKSEPWRFL